LAGASANEAGPRALFAHASADLADASANKARPSAKATDAPAKSSGTGAEGNIVLGGASFALLKSNMTQTAIIFGPVDVNRAGAQVGLTLQSGKIWLPAARR
jgi:hypothetical protein